MSTTKAAKMTSLLESCGDTAEFFRLVRHAIATLDGAAPSEELAAVLDSVDAATDAAAALDAAVSS